MGAALPLKTVLPIRRWDQCLPLPDTADACRASANPRIPVMETSSLRPALRDRRFVTLGAAVFAAICAFPAGAQGVRVEKDLLGTKEVPAEAYYGVQTARALENFQI